MSIDLAVIGGTGLYNFPGLQDVQRRAIETPYGEPSGAIVVGTLGGRTIAFLARHGEDHRHAPHRVNYRANVWALHEAGARRMVGVNAVGGIRDDMASARARRAGSAHRLHLGTPEQFQRCRRQQSRAHRFHRTVQRRHAPAVCCDAAKRASIPVVDGGCYGATQGPRLETRAEIARMKRDGCDLVGMTGMPEAALARELGIDYACLALVANWAAGCGDEAAISIDEIFAHLHAATANVPPIISALLAAL